MLAHLPILVRLVRLPMRVRLPMPARIPILVRLDLEDQQKAAAVSGASDLAVLGHPDPS